MRLMKAGGVVAAVCLSVGADVAVGGDDGVHDFAGTPVAQLFEESCANCHSGDEPPGGVLFESTRVDLSDEEARRILVRAFDRVKAGEMPPEEDVPLEPSLRESALASLAGTLAEYDERDHAEHGRSRLRRLSRVEYQHTIQDLLKVNTAVGGLLPYDTNAHGFDRTADALTLSDVLIEKYLEAAEAALADAVVSTPKPETATQTFDYLQPRYLDQKIFRREGDAVAFFTQKYVPSELKEFRVETPGRYRIRVAAETIQHDKPLVYSVTHGDVIGGRRGKQIGGYFEAPVGEFGVGEFVGHFDRLDSVKITPFIPSQPQGIWQDGAADYDGAGLAVKTVEVTGPLVDEWPPASHRALFGDLPVVLNNAEELQRKKWATPDMEVVSENPREDARRLLTDFAARAFRRPIRNGELDAYFELIDADLAAGRRFQDAYLTGVKAVLVSPDFLTLGGEGEPADDGRLSPFQLASRLSYFLWSSLPDEELLASARSGKLTESDELRRQTDRMLADAKSQRLVDDLLRQWLDLEWIDASTPDPGLYPEFDDLLKKAMVDETTLYLTHLFENDLGIANLVDSDFTFLNERLAKHYGIDGVEGLAMRKVDLPDDCCRGGVLTQAAIAKVTANGTNTSPVLRGLWLLENILGEHVPPPPKNVPAVEPDVRGATTVREQFAAHRTDPVCASCHNKIDPLGFAMEAFDPIGGQRDRYRAMGAGPRSEDVVKGLRVAYSIGPEVEMADTLPTGRSFADIVTFKKLLCEDCDQLARCYVGKLLVYSTGAGLSFADRQTIEEIVEDTREDGHGMRSILHAVIQSDAFRSR